MHASDASRRPVGYQQISSATLASATALTVPTGARIAIIQCETVSVRWRDDGTNPDSTTGMLLAAGDDIVYTGNLNKVKIIRTAANSVVNVSYYA